MDPERTLNDQIYCAAQLDRLSAASMARYGHRPRGRRRHRLALFRGGTREVRNMIRRLAFGFVALVSAGSSAFAFDRASCKLTVHDYEVMATLKNPVTRDAQGQLIRNGKVMPAVLFQDACITRRMYDLMAKREKQGKTLTVKEIADMGYVPGYLTEDERKRLSDHVHRVLQQ
jgi:hypothetical protein